MKPSPDARVIEWLDANPIETLYLAAITQAELLFGVEVLPAGRRKRGLLEAVSALLKLYEGRILPFDTQAAARYSPMAAGARRKGKAFPMADGYIAAIAVSQDGRVATRDTGPYLAAGVPIINPWE